MQQPRKQPMRKCVGCNEMKPKRELIRAVKSPEGGVSLDLGGKAPGRGAYVCPNVECLKKARKARRLERAFSSQIPAEIYDGMEAQLEAKNKNEN
ncbi:MAG: YlxR family protein [Oscillospiraceae bacterium]|nr:YlxR family protein [Oscillospiraceae bacterium]